MLGLLGFLAGQPSTQGGVPASPVPAETVAGSEAFALLLAAVSGSVETANLTTTPAADGAASVPGIPGNDEVAGETPALANSAVMTPAPGDVAPAGQPLPPVVPGEQVNHPVADLPKAPPPVDPTDMTADQKPTQLPVTGLPEMTTVSSPLSGLELLPSPRTGPANEMTPPTVAAATVPALSADAAGQTTMSPPVRMTQVGESTPLAPSTPSTLSTRMDQSAPLVGHPRALRGFTSPLAVAAPSGVAGQELPGAPSHLGRGTGSPLPTPAGPTTGMLPSMPEPSALPREAAPVMAANAIPMPRETYPLPRDPRAVVPEQHTAKIDADIKNLKIAVASETDPAPATDATLRDLQAPATQANLAHDSVPAHQEVHEAAVTVEHLPLGQAPVELTTPPSDGTGYKNVDATGRVAPIDGTSSSSARTAVTRQVAGAVASRLGSSGEQTMTIRLMPEELGQVDVTLSARGNQLQVTLLAGTVDAERALREGLGDLIDSLALRATKYQNVDVRIEQKETTDERTQQRGEERREGASRGSDKDGGSQRRSWREPQTTAEAWADLARGGN